MTLGSTKIGRYSFKLPFGFDWSLFLLPLILSLLGIAVIFTITYGMGKNLALSQSFFLIIGLSFAVLLSFVDYRTIKGLYLILYLITLALLIYVFFFGKHSLGAARWIDLGFFQLQPSELCKPVILIVLAKFFADWKEINLAKIIFTLVLVAVPLFFVLRQPDLGTALVIFFGFLTILFLSPIKKVYLIVGLAICLALSPIGWRFLKPYQKNRIIAFINPSADPKGVGYNVNQAKIAVGSGGLWGQGFGKGSQSILNFLPVVYADFIFAGTAEATGFVGSTFLILIFCVLLIRIIFIARSSKDDFGMYLAGGVTGIFFFQMLVNIGMNMGIMPVTGIPLPFVSYGGSAMLVNLAIIGILQSIYLRRKKITF